MAIYAIGDVQGCYKPLQRLLERIKFDPGQDKLWFCGDLVNRGPDSLAVLKLVRGLGDAALSVLGNHDLTLLAAAAGVVKIRRKDTFADVLNASDAADHIHWLRHCPMLHHDLGYTMVHAGLAAQWDLAKAQACAGELENVLQGSDTEYETFLANMFGQRPDRWSDDLSGHDRLRCIVNILTRMRFCYPDGSLDFDHKGPPGSQSKPLQPWFRLERRNQSLNILFGHWAALGFYRAPGIYALDSGCVWGKKLTAIRLDGQEQIYQVPAK